MKAIYAMSLLLALVPAAGAQDLKSEVQTVAPEMIKIRHQIHANPELSNREVETSKLIAKELKGMGLEVKSGVAHTGVVALLKGGKPGPVVAVRADIDALPITEDTDFPFKSTKRGEYQGQEVGVAHACGHDIHIAVALGTAKLLAQHRDSLPGTVKFIFQPAEEGVPPGEKGGAEYMAELGVLDNPKPEAIFALHSWPDSPVGEVSVVSGPIWASSDRFSIDLKGKQAHGAWPHESVDPIVMASQAVMAFQTIISRNVDPRQPRVLTVGVLRSGERFNVIPGSAHLEGTVRTYSADVQKQIQARMRQILDGVTQAAGGTYEFQWIPQTPPTINDPKLAKWAIADLRKRLGAGNVPTGQPVMGAEDFAFFSNEVPGFYFRLGVVKAGTTSGGLHTPNFRGDDSAIPVGIRAMSGLVLDYLESGGPGQGAS